MQRWLVLALVFGLGGCGTRAAPDPGRAEPGPRVVRSARSALPGLVGRRCHFASPRDAMPDFYELARAGTRGNVALWGYALAPTDSIEVSVRYGEDGQLVWVRAIRSTLPDHRTAPLEGLLLQALNERGPADWGVRLQVVGGDVVGVEPSVICPPELRTGIRSPVPLPLTARGFRALEQARGRRFRVLISIDEQGRVLGVRLPMPSGDDVVNQFLVDWVHASQFRPKLHDGVGLPTTFEETLYIPRRR